MNKSVKEGWYNVPPINTERYGERAGLEGPFQTKAGKVVYYDPKEGAYYDPDSDIYLSYEEWAALNESVKYGVVYTTADDKIVPMLHKNYDTRDAAVKVAEAAVRTGSYKAYNILEANVPGSPYNGMDRETRQIYQNLLYHGGGGSWTAQKAAQAAKNRTALAASADYHVYTEKDVKTDGDAAKAKYKEVAALFNKEKAKPASDVGQKRRMMALKKAGDELSNFPHYLGNQAWAEDGYSAIFSGKKPWEELSEMAKANVVRKQAQIKKKKEAINALMTKIGLDPIQFTNMGDAVSEGKLPAHLAKFVDDKGDFTPEVKARLGKDGEERLLGKKKDEKMNESYQDEMNKIHGAIDAARAAIPALQAEGDMRKVVALKAAVEGLIYAVNKAGNTGFHIARIHELLNGGNVTESDDADRIARHSENLKDARAELRAATTASEKAHLKAEIAKYQARIDKIKKTPIKEAKADYNKDAVDREIKKDKRIGGKEAKAIHGLLKGRTAEKKTVKEEEEKYRVVGKSRADDSVWKSGVLSKEAAEERAKKMRAAKRKDGAPDYDSVKIVKEDIALDAAGMEQDHEVQMARGQLYHAARDAIRLHQMLKTISEDNGIEAWVQSKITTAAEYLKTVADYMEYELINDGIDSTVGISADQVQMPIGETTSGGIAAVAMPLGTIQKRKRPVKK